MAKRRPSGDGMVRKKSDGRWEGRIVVGHKENGDPIFRYVYGATQKELLSKLHQSIDQYQDVELTEDSRLTVAQWLERWLSEYMPGTIRDGTLKGYRMYARNYVNPYIGDKIVSQVTSFDFQKLYAKLRTQGRLHPHPEHGNALADATICRVHCMLHLAMKTAAREHLIPKNPVDGVTSPKPNYRPKQILNEEQMDTFLAAVDKDEIWRDLFYVELTTGLRRGELCGLKWQDFDEDAGTLRIERSVGVKGGGELTIDLPKTPNSIRTIILPPSTTDRLRERKKTALTEWVFHDPLHPESPVKPNSAYNRMKTILKNEGLPSIRFHALRHTFSTHALASGVDAKTLSGILGHANASFTLDTYTHVTGDMQKQAAGIVGGFMEDIFGKELKPWQRSEKMGTFASAASGGCSEQKGVAAAPLAVPEQGPGTAMRQQETAAYEQKT